jgi:hypothetical protein
VPAISDALSVQPSSSYETSQGPTNETTPIEIEALERSRKSDGSTARARNDRREARDEDEPARPRIEVEEVASDDAEPELE